MNKQSELIKQVAIAAGNVIKKMDSKAGLVKKEGRANFTTAADLASEKTIIEIIKAKFPKDRIISEETESDLTNILSLNRAWIIDPIDGTNNFYHRRNYSVVSIGYVEKGIIKTGAVYNPFNEELFFAEKGKGAFLNNSRISVGSQTELLHATVATDNSATPEGSRYNLELAANIEPTPWVLITGCAVLAMCEVACGRIDLYFHTYLKPWDNAAAFLLIQESGGIIRGLDSEEITFLSPNAVVGNSALVKQFLQNKRST